MKRFKYSAYLTIVLAILVMTMTSLSFYPVIRADGTVTGEAHEPGGAAGNYDDNTTGGGTPEDQAYAAEDSDGKSEFGHNERPGRDQVLKQKAESEMVSAEQELFEAQHSSDEQKLETEEAQDLDTITNEFENPETGDSLGEVPVVDTKLKEFSDDPGFPYIERSGFKSDQPLSNLNGLDTAVVEEDTLMAKAPAAPNTVQLIGQWVNDSSEHIDTHRTYDNLDDVIGKPEANSGLLRGLAKTFLGWSDKPPVDNGALAPDARLYSPFDTIGTVFPAGIPAEAKLYGVYFSINQPPEEGFPQDPFSLTALGQLADQLKTLVNQNTVLINSAISAENTLQNTDNAYETAMGLDRTIIDYYRQTDDLSETHEVVLEASFSMNNTVAMLVYKNPVGSNQLRPILSRNYKEKYQNDSFGLASGAASDYTYMDLVVTLDKDIQLPQNKMYLELDAWSWRPLFVLDAAGTRLPIINPYTGANCGNTSAAFSSMVSPSKTTTFAVDLSQAQLSNAAGEQQITLRAVLRKNKLNEEKEGEWKDEKIAEDQIVPSSGKTVAETIQEDMKLRALTSQQIIAKGFAISGEESLKSCVTITDAKALELAKTNGAQTLKVSGYVEGYAISDAGTVDAYGFSFPLTSAAEITRCPANTIYLGYTLPAIPTEPDPSIPTIKPHPCPSEWTTVPQPILQPVAPLSIDPEKSVELLPRTGENRSPAYSLAMLAIVLMGAFFCLRKRS